MGNQNVTFINITTECSVYMNHCNQNVWFYKDPRNFKYTKKDKLSGDKLFDSL